MSIIKDPILEPFYLKQDAYCYEVIEDYSYDDKERLKSHSYHPTLSRALKSILKLKMSKKDKYDSIEEYLTECKKFNDELKEVLTNIESKFDL